MPHRADVHFRSAHLPWPANHRPTNETFVNIYADVWLSQAPSLPSLRFLLPSHGEAAQLRLRLRLFLRSDTTASQSASLRTLLVPCPMLWLKLYKCSGVQVG